MYARGHLFMSFYCDKNKQKKSDKIIIYTKIINYIVDISKCMYYIKYIAILLLKIIE